MSVQMLDEKKSEQFAGQLLGVMNHAGLALMISIGHRTGLFDTLAEMPPSTSDAIARESQLNERYVREWLGAMVAGGIVEFDPVWRRYHLPPEHASWLTREASPNNLAVTAQWFAVLGGAENDLVEAFSHGRGVPYHAYDRFHEVMAEESDQTVVAALEHQILGLVPGVVERLERGITVLEVGCGRGHALTELARRFPQSRFRGIDMSETAIGYAREGARARGLDNAAFEVRDAATLDAAGTADLVLAFDAIHDQAQPAEVLRRVRRALAPDGVFLMQDIKAATALEDNKSHPLGPFLYTISCMHCMSVSLASGGPGLGAAWGRELALEMLDGAGFTSVEVHELPHDMINYYYVARAGQGR
jgi:2-polyprenyl-3-methyl-5-hydroxy-6-metoxy-1,4-benzoquinol methylase